LSAAYQETKKRGFDLYCAEGTVRRLSPTLTAIKTGLEGYWIVELKDGKWTCDCVTAKTSEFCEHIYAAQLAKRTNRTYETEAPDEATMKCKYCGSPDIRRCGYRYNARGISRRYYCNECERKFTMRIIASEHTTANMPVEVVWLLDEVGIQVSKLNLLLADLDSKLAGISRRSATNEDDLSPDRSDAGNASSA
jgi:hypothetical protein